MDWIWSIFPQKQAVQTVSIIVVVIHIDAPIPNNNLPTVRFTLDKI